MAAAGALDMTLDDVIKKKGGRGGRGAKKGGAGAQASRKGAQRKAEAAGTAAPAIATGRRSGLSEAAKSALGAVAVKDKATTKSKGPLGTLTAAMKGLGLPIRTLGVKPVDRQSSEKTPAKDGTPKRAAGKNARPAAAPPAAAAGAAPKGTEEKLSMTLEDMIKCEVKKGRKPEKAKADGAAVAGGAEGGGSRRGGRRRRGMMKLRKEAAAPKAKAQGKAKAKANDRGRGGMDWGKSAGGQWAGGGWGGRAGGAGGMRGWTAGPGKRSRLEEDYEDWGPAPQAKRMRAVSGLDFGWGSGRGRLVDDRWGPGDSWGGGSGSAGRGRDGPAWSRDWDDRDRVPIRERERERPRVPPAPLDWGPMKAERDTGRRLSGFTTIRVSNVPRNLDWRDIKDAFEDNGRVIRCEVERGVAYVTFDNAQDAKKAVQTFDRGELNGQTIFVTPE